MYHAQKFGKDRACGSEDILADKQTHIHTYSSQYFATTPAGEVTRVPGRMNVLLLEVRHSLCKGCNIPQRSVGGVLSSLP